MTQNSGRTPAQSDRVNQIDGMRRLVSAVQDLSHARTLDTVVAVIRRAARELTGADGASFILRDANQCFYVDEDAIGPLWKGQRFPMTACVSGWAMIHRQPAVIPNIYSDARVPVDAYRPTFVKSMVMVPIRTESPIGAIGNYWAHEHCATEVEVELLQALANTASVALENVQLYSDLETRVRDRTVQLEDTIRELEAFSFSVSHDLRGPLSVLSGSADMLERSYASSLPEAGRKYISYISQATHGMSRLIDDLLRLARLTKTELRQENVDLGVIARQIAERISETAPQRSVEFQIQPDLQTVGDAGLLNVVIDNLVGNAWKYTSKADHAVIQIGRLNNAPDRDCFFIRDNGVGFDMNSAGKLFIPFQRLHSNREFEGHGIGLATVQRIIHRHGGRIWAEAEEGKGATFFFTLAKASLLKAVAQ